MAACDSGTMTEPAHPPARVLVVEDDRELGPLLLRLFSGAGYAPDLALDGQAGLHLALTRRYDAIILDRGLPAIEGLDLLGRLRRSGITTPTIVLTALGTVFDRVAGLDGAPRTIWSSRSRSTSSWPACGFSCGDARTRRSL